MNNPNYSENSRDAYEKADLTACENIKSIIAQTGCITYKQLEKITGYCSGTLTGRLNDLRFIHKTVVVDGKKDGCALYRIRKEAENADTKHMTYKQKYDRIVSELKSLTDAAIFVDSMSINQIIMRNEDR